MATLALNLYHLKHIQVGARYRYATGSRGGSVKDTSVCIVDGTGKITREEIRCFQ
jgi:hypothetical protein